MGAIRLRQAGHFAAGYAGWLPISPASAQHSFYPVNAARKASGRVIFVLVVFPDGARSEHNTSQASSLEAGLVSGLVLFHEALPVPADCVAGSAEAPDG
jgi:hypothetical protein